MNPLNFQQNQNINDSEMPERPAGLGPKGYDACVENTRNAHNLWLSKSRAASSVHPQARQLSTNVSIAQNAYTNNPCAANQTILNQAKQTFEQLQLSDPQGYAAIQETKQLASDFSRTQREMIIFNNWNKYHSG